MGIYIIEENCTGCGKCIPACPFGSIKVVAKKAVIGEDCVICGACQNACEVDAIIIDRGAAKGTENIDEYKGVLVFIEQHGGELKDCGLELLGAGR